MPIQHINKKINPSYKIFKTGPRGPMSVVIRLDNDTQEWYENNVFNNGMKSFHNLKMLKKRHCLSKHFRCSK